MPSPGTSPHTPKRASGEALVCVRDLTVHYLSEGGRRLVAVDQAHFDLRAGEVLGVLGESGAGKSTLGLALLSLLPAGARIVSGSIRLGDTELTGLTERSWRKWRGAEIGFIFQEPGLALNPVLRVGTQIEEVIRAHRPWSRSRCRAAAEAALDEVGLGDEAGASRAYPHELSGGQQKRVLIAQAIACRPRLLVADEPVSALDAVTRAGILALLAELKQRLGLAMLLIAHELASVTALADRVAVMYAGRLVEEGPTGALLTEPLHPYTRGLLAAQPRPRTSPPCPGVVPSSPAVPRVWRRAPAVLPARSSRLRRGACAASSTGAECRPGDFVLDTSASATGVAPSYGVASRSTLSKTWISPSNPERRWRW